ncbi:DUF7286 family protein [Haloarchaeobius sp. TZWWS8]|uniref:DUF7286 family protein n=1 Tax=Haloarchaeobius sp. TZWWS8 TaxID=3446121 RepID=UPI003EBF880A
MRLADDERARVPFALVGVLLLVSSATLVGTLSTRHPGGAIPDSDVAVERAEGTVLTTLRGAVDRAARNAGSNPVVTPASTGSGQVLNESSPFRDSLRLRIYRQASDALTGVDVSVGDARVTASLPPVSESDSLRAALARVHVARTGNGTMAVRVEDVSFALRYRGRVVEREERTISFTAATPVLLVHDKVTVFEERLNRGPTEGPGFGRQFAARLYAWAWARGYVQYAQPRGDTTVSNVVSPAYVSLSANEAALATQQATFGRADAAGTRALGLARLDLLATEGLGLMPLPETGVPPGKWVDLVLGDPSGTMAYATPSVPEPVNTGYGPSSQVTVGVNESADEAFRVLLGTDDGDGEDGRSLAEVVRRAYGADVRFEAAVRRVSHDPARPPTPPAGEGWREVDSRTDRTVTVSSKSAPVPAASAGWHRLGWYEREVRVLRTTRTTWHRWNWTNRTVGVPEIRQTTDRRESRYRVGIAALAEPSPDVPGPDNSIAGVFSTDGPLGGGNLYEIRPRVSALVAERGGADALARRAVAGTLDESETRVHVAPPDGIEEFVFDGLPALRESARTVTVEATRGSLATTETPARELAAKLRTRRASLVAAPTTYGSVASRARTAVRSAYLDQLDRELSDRARATERGRGGLDDALEAVDLSLAGLADTMAAQRRAASPEPPTLGGGPAGPLRLRVDAVPSYLVLNEVASERAASIRTSGYHPLVTRNRNLFTVPYGEAVDAVTSAAKADAEAGRVGLSAATPGLFAMDAAVREMDDRAARRHRDELRDAVEGTLDAVESRVAADVAATTDLRRSQADAAVAAGLSTYPTTAHRAAATVNGSAAGRMATEVVARSERFDGGRDRAELRVRIRASLQAAVDAETGRLDAEVLSDATDFLRSQHDGLVSAAGTAMLSETDRAARQTRFGNESVYATFAGLPLLPFYSWVATVNVWDVEARGSYARFTVRTDYGSPATPGGSFVYSRDGAAVAVDVDGDGVRERLGYADRVAFESRVGVLVAVPPGKTGVGDLDGNWDERSAGWPCPGPRVWPPREPPSGDGDEEASRCGAPLYRPVENPGMFYEQRMDVDGLSPDDLEDEYAADLASVVDSQGVDAVVGATGLDRTTVETLADGEVPGDLTLQEAAAVQSLADGVADADTVFEMACEHLLLGMTTGVMDIEAVAMDLDDEFDLGPTEIQQKIERRAPMTFHEFVHVQHVIASRQR